MDGIFEPGRMLPVAGEFDLCVIGGSCTGVFAAVRAARLGLRVALVEQNVILGGTATAAQVCEWHSLYDVCYGDNVIGGLTVEVILRLLRRGAAMELPKNLRTQFRFNPAELASELDQLIQGIQIRVFFSARFSASLQEETKDGRVITAAIIEDKSGRRAICARTFIDASGDGDLVRRAGFPVEQSKSLQPVNTHALVAGLQPFLQSPECPYTWETLRRLAPQFNYPSENGSPWFLEYPGAPDLVNIFGPRCNGVDASDADALSRALVEGRRQLQALMEMLRATYDVQPHIVSWPHALGVRETWHARCLHRLTVAELLCGEVFPDAIANGTYPIDIHHTDGTTLRYLDGREENVLKNGAHQWGRWRDESDTPHCYHIPYRSLVPQGAANVLVAGRIFDADKGAYGAARVMVNMNQTGEAAGVAAALAVHAGTSVSQVNPTYLRQELSRGGSIIL